MQDPRCRGQGLRESLKKVDEIGTYAAREFPLISTCTVDCKTGPDGRAREGDRDREPEGLPAAHIAASS